MYMNVKKMAESAGGQYQDQFSCSICLDPLKEPVTIPCGHSYCMSCITDYWDQKDQEPQYRCPQCRETFTKRPLLRKNTLLAEMMEKLQMMSVHNHKFIKRSTQGKPLETYCGTKSVNSEWKKKKNELKETNVKCQKMIQGRKRAQQELSEALKSLKSSAQEAIEDSEEIFTELICSLKNKHSEIKKQIRAQEKAEIDRAEDLHKRLHQELKELRQRKEDIEKILIRDYQGHYVKSFQSVYGLPKFEDLPSITQHPHLIFKDISISKFKEVLEDVCQQEAAKISRQVSNVHVAQCPEPKTPDEFFQYSCQLQLDPNTAHNKLRLSHENRKVSYSWIIKKYSNHPERFDWFLNILCREGLYGRCYWEVECCGDIWAVAVCYKRIQRKGDSNECKLGFNKESWRLSRYRQKLYFTHDEEKVCVRAVCPSRVGVYLDHSAGILSFYSVSDTILTQLCRVRATFTKALYPAFRVGKDSSVRIIE